MIRHQYVERRTGDVRDERMYHDRLVRWLYGSAREHAPTLFKALTSARMTRLLGYLNYDSALGAKLTGSRRFVQDLGIDLSECVDPGALDTPRRVFERQIRFWERRPMPLDERRVVAPADARVLVGSLREDSRLFLKGKFFDFGDLVGHDREDWRAAFSGGPFAIFRLTPDKYHYNHAPASGEVRDIYAIEGGYHSCHPDAIVALSQPYSKNRRVVTVIDTDVPGGTGAGLVAMIEIAALMVGGIEQAYSDERYEDPQPVVPGLFVRRGQPKSLFRPGGSTVVLLFQADRVRFDDDLVLNGRNRDVRSRFTSGFVSPMVETDIAVRSSLGRALP